MVVLLASKPMKKKIMKKKLLFSMSALLISTLLWVQTASAQWNQNYEDNPDQWKSQLSGYLWALSMDGTAEVLGNEIDLDLSFGDLLDDLDFALSLRFESHKGNMGYFLDGMAIRLKPETTGPMGGTISQEVNSFIGEVGGIYHFNPKVEGIYGVRYQAMDVEVDLPAPAGTVEGDVDWTDIFVGLRYVPVRTDKWLVWLRGDVGGGDSDSTWNGVIGASYHINKRWSLGGGYRILTNDYQEDDFSWNVDYQGVSFILGYTFQPG
jgi:opacity protein-like surface antigen